MGQLSCSLEYSEARISRNPKVIHRCFHKNHQALDKQNGESTVLKSEAARRKVKEREFFYSVLSSSATKRDAKAYLSKFKPNGKPKPSIRTPEPVQNADSVEVKQHKEYQGRLNKSGVNLGGLYTYPTAIEDSPVFSHEPLPETFSTPEVEPLHLAIVVLRWPQHYTEEVLDGVALTLAQLARLGLLSVVVIDTRENGVNSQPSRSWLDEVNKQSMRLASAIGKHSTVGARVVDQALGITNLDANIASSVHVRGRVHVQLEAFLFTPLKSGILPVIPPIAFTDMAQMQQVSADDVVLALTRQFAGFNWPLNAEDNSETAAPTNADSEASEGAERASLDRIIVLDPIGGIPSENRPEKQHIFINLDQEYDSIRSELQHQDQAAAAPPKEKEERFSLFGASNPFSKFVETEIAPFPKQQDQLTTPPPSQSEHHLQNLDLIHNALTLLPPTSSALLTTPSEAASAAVSASTPQTTGVRTRPKRNPLIHNLLTDKSVISSSLPPARLSTSSSSVPMEPHSTFIKRGMPVTIIPDPFSGPWTPPGPEGTTLDLATDPRIDFPRLQHLIEDSFSRPLDAPHYLSRTQKRIAGLIIAGNYLGGAILTWEIPPWNTSRPPVPYLDKFAVLKSAQGSGGVADILFNAMVRNCFPHGVVWRSRVDNPVNRWYFERAGGTWRIPGGKWCMFWTGQGVDFGEVRDKGEMEERKLRWRDYVSVCEGVEASWADGKDKPPD